MEHERAGSEMILRNGKTATHINSGDVALKSAHLNCQRATNDFNCSTLNSSNWYRPIYRKCHEVSVFQKLSPKPLKISLTEPKPVTVLLSNLVSEMVIVTVPPLPPAAMAPPYKVDVPPPDMQHRAGSQNA